MQVISAFMLVSIIFVPIGIASLFASRDVRLTLSLFMLSYISVAFYSFFFLFSFFLYSYLIVHLPFNQVVEIVDRYDTECIPMQNRTDKVGYIRSSADKMCNRTLKVRVLCLIASLLLLFVVCFLINNIICGTQTTGVVICSLS